MTLLQAAESALMVQDACNACGIVNSLHSIMADVLIPYGHGTRWVNSHPIVTMYLLKLSELNGCGSTLHASYDVAEAAVRNIIADQKAYAYGTAKTDCCEGTDLHTTACAFHPGPVPTTTEVA